MAETNTSPSFLDQLQSFGFSAANKWVDVETKQSDNNIPDNVDVKHGQAPSQSGNMAGVSSKIAGLPVWGWGALGVGALVLGLVAFRK